jgi:hypothetical protein
MVYKYERIRPIINWDRTDRIIDTEYGVITYMDWCKKEAKRLDANFLTKFTKKQLYCCVSKDG